MARSPGRSTREWRSGARATSARGTRDRGYVHRRGRFFRCHEGFGTKRPRREVLADDRMRHAGAAEDQRTAARRDGAGIGQLGAIGVDSVEGQGSTFWFSLPMPIGATEAAEPRRPRVRSAARRRRWRGASAGRRRGAAPGTLPRRGRSPSRPRAPRGRAADRRGESAVRVVGAERAERRPYNAANPAENFRRPDFRSHDRESEAPPAPPSAWRRRSPAARRPGAFPCRCRRGCR